MRPQAENGLYACPCCGYATLNEVAGFEICRLCRWEDDGQDDPQADEAWGGPNAGSLSEARANYLVFLESDANAPNLQRPQPSDVLLRQFVLGGGKGRIRS